MTQVKTRPLLVKAALLLATTGVVLLLVVPRSSAPASQNPALWRHAAALSEVRVGGYDYACGPLGSTEIRCDGQPAGSQPVVWYVEPGSSLVLVSP